MKIERKISDHDLDIAMNKSRDKVINAITKKNTSFSFTKKVLPIFSLMSIMFIGFYIIKPNIVADQDDFSEEVLQENEVISLGMYSLFNEYNMAQTTEIKNNIDYDSVMDNFEIYNSLLTSSLHSNELSDNEYEYVYKITLNNKDYYLMFNDGPLGLGGFVGVLKCDNMEVEVVGGYRKGAIRENFFIRTKAIGPKSTTFRLSYNPNNNSTTYFIEHSNMSKEIRILKNSRQTRIDMNVNNKISFSLQKINDKVKVTFKNENQSREVIIEIQDDRYIIKESGKQVFERPKH